MSCEYCPRHCRNRRHGSCGVEDKIIVGRIAPHFWEEPVISGSRGSGAVFFSGCSLNCVFCQNREISASAFGQIISEKELASRIENLVKKGVHNINFVTPSHYSLFLASFLDKYKFGVPVVYNTSAYDDIKALGKLKRKVQIFLPDMKYIDPDLAKKYSGAANYVEVAKKSIEKMYSLVGDCEYDENGLLKKGVIVRHLMLPDNLENTLGVIDWFEEFSKGKKVLFSLMRQYTPCGDLSAFPELQRKVSDEEYEQAKNYLYLNGIDGFLQEAQSCDDSYIPYFSNNLDEVEE